MPDSEFNVLNLRDAQPRFIEDFGVMIELLTAQIASQLKQATELYYRLIVVVVPPDNSQTMNFRACAERLDSQYININLELSRRLLELTQRQ